MWSIHCKICTYCIIKRTTVLQFYTVSLFLFSRYFDQKNNPQLVTLVRSAGTSMTQRCQNRLLLSQNNSVLETVTVINLKAILWTIYHIFIVFLSKEKLVNIYIGNRPMRLCTTTNLPRFAFISVTFSQNDLNVLFSIQISHRNIIRSASPPTSISSVENRIFLPT